MIRHLILPTFALLFCAFAAPAQATDACTQTLDALPATIIGPGHYCLTADYTGSSIEPAIHIQSDDVTLDCQGHRLTSTLTPNPAPAIAADNRGTGVHNVVVRDCRIRNYAVGILFAAPSEDILLVDNEISRSREAAIMLWARNASIVNNRIVNPTGQAGNAYDGRGISVQPLPPGESANGIIVAGNTIVGASGDDRFWGIHAERADGIVIERNSFLDAMPPTGGVFTAVHVGGSLGARVNDNLFRSIYGSQKIVTGSAAQCERNTVFGVFVNGFLACTSAQRNAIFP